MSNSASDDEPIVMSKRKGDDEIDMTPMIDVTFLLLIFFVVTSDMNPEKAAELPPARNGGVISLMTAAIVEVGPGSGELPEVLVGDGRKLPDDPDGMELQLTDFLRSEADQGKSMVVVQGNGNATTGQVALVRKIISQALEDLEVIHIAVVERP
jgi:biopolymer transport protein ExbD